MAVNPEEESHRFHSKQMGISVTIRRLEDGEEVHRRTYGPSGTQIFSTLSSATNTKGDLQLLPNWRELMKCALTQILAPG
jgi:hypothetical protein